MSLGKEVDIYKELKCLRKHLSPVLSDHFKSILKVAEEKLNGETSVLLENGSKKKKITVKRPTKKELYNRFFYKNQL